MEYKFKQLSKTKDKTEYEVTVDFKELVPYQEAAYQRLSRDVKIKGFRPGKAPKAKIMARIGTDVIDMALRTLLPNVTAEIVQKEKARPIEAPTYNIEKMDAKDGIVYKFTYTDYPEVKFGDFSKIKVKKDKTEVTTDDIDLVIKNIIRSSVKPERIRELTDVTEVKETKKKSDSKAKGKDDKDKLVQDVTELDESKQAGIEDFKLNNNLVKELGYEEEKNLEEMRKSVEIRLKDMKAEQADQKYADEIIQKAVEMSTFEIPQLFIDREVDSQRRQFQDRLDQLKLDAKTYLKTQGSDIEKKEKEWTEAAERKIGVDLLLINLADKNSGIATDDDVEAEINKIEDPVARGQYKNESGREYVRTIVTRQKGLEHLMDMVEGKSDKKVDSKQKTDDSKEVEKKDSKSKTKAKK